MNKWGTTVHHTQILFCPSISIVGWCHYPKFAPPETRQSSWGLYVAPVPKYSFTHLEILHAVAVLMWTATKSPDILCSVVIYMF